jgi:hypothetical protein
MVSAGFRLAVVAAIGFMMAAPAAPAAAYPDITGTWSVDTDAVVLGDTPQWPDPADPKDPQLEEFHPKLVIEKVAKDRFWGKYISPTRTQEAVGVFTGEGTHFLITFEHGFGLGHVISKNEIRWCYSQSMTKEIPAEVTGCNDAKRK